MARLEVLAFHAPWRCRDSGVCCTSGWPIPVEVALHRTLAAALASGRLPLPRVPAADPFVAADLPPEYARLLAVHPDGACAFHDGGRGGCAIHSALGPGAKPVSCRAFPWVTVIDPRGVSRSLSHYCPSAVDLLFADRPIAIVDDAGAAAEEGVEGLDARDGLPPALREDALVDWDSLRAWDRHVLAVLDAAATPEVALDRLWASYARLRTWRAIDGALPEHVARLSDAGVAGRGAGHDTPARRVDAARLVAAVRAAIPSPLRAGLTTSDAASVPPATSARAGVEAGAVADARDADADRAFTAAWRSFGRVLCRYVAARAHACWPLHQGRGLQTQLVYLDAVLATVRSHAAAWSRHHHRPLDAAGLRESIRQSDLWLVHLAAPDVLARSLDTLPPG